MSPELFATSIAILGLGLAGTFAACLRLWLRVRALSANPGSVDRESSKPGGDLPGRVDGLLAEHRSLEARLARLEALVPVKPAVPKTSRRVDQGTRGGPTLISVPDLATPPAPTTEAAAELDRRFGPVWSLADDGVPVAEIARETGYPIGQVELILGLRRRLLAPEARPDV